MPRPLRRRGKRRWPGVHADVGTDRARLDVVSDLFLAAFKDSPIAAEGSPGEERRIRCHAVDGLVGELSVPAQRQRADAAPPARPGTERPAISRRVGRPAVRPRARRPGLLSDPDRGLQEGNCSPLRHDRNWFNTSRPAPATAATTTGQGSAQTKTEGADRIPEDDLISHELRNPEGPFSLVR